MTPTVEQSDLRERVAQRLFNGNAEEWQQLPEIHRLVFMAQAKAALEAAQVDAMRSRIERLEGLAREARDQLMMTQDYSDDRTVRDVCSRIDAVLGDDG